jgi:ABC-2 type transport system ATP-binding protein
VNAIETRHLTRFFGDRVAVDDLNVEIPTGSVFGFLGPNGAGKTTTVRMLTALIAPSSGSARVAGFELGQDDEAIRRNVGILTESPGMYDRLTARQNLVYFGRLYGLDSDRASKQSERYLRMLGLWDRRDDKVGTFSKGMRQKLAVARAVLHEPQIVFFDEPTSGLDPEAARIVRNFVRELRGGGRTIFLTTHNLPEADELCDLVAVFRGKLLRLDTPASLRRGLFGHGTQVRVAGDGVRWLAPIRALPFVTSATASDGVISIRLDNPDEENPILVRALVAAGANIRAVEPTEHTLEDVYIELIESPTATEGAHMNHA